VRRPAGRLKGFEAMKDRLEGIQNLRVLESAVAGPDGGGASLGDVDKSRGIRRDREGGNLIKEGLDEAFFSMQI
jgi:hypothetical protein